MATAIDTLAECVEQAKDASAQLNKTPGLKTEKNLQRFQWLERQITQLLNTLKAVQADIDAGCPLGDLGYSTASEFQEHLLDVRVQISSLRAMLRHLMLER